MSACWKSSSGRHHWTEHLGRTMCYYCGEWLDKEE